MELKTWGDLAKNYNLILFNKCIELGHGEVLNEWAEQHNEACESEIARYHLETCDKKKCKQCIEYKNNYGDNSECECQPYQWYVININEYDQKYLNDTFDLGIFYSDYLDLYILPVYHYGTSWDILNLNGGYATEK